MEDQAWLAILQNKWRLNCIVCEMTRECCFVASVISSVLEERRGAPLDAPRRDRF
jgi:hypothetical protein